MPQLYFFYPSASGGRDMLHTPTMGFALQNIADKIGATYIAHAETEGIHQLEVIPPSDEPTIFFMHFNIYAELQHYQKLKEKRPNLKVVIFGSDNHYYRTSSVRWPIDLFMGTMSETVDKLKGEYNAEFFYWNISETAIKLIKNIEECCLMPAKCYDGISLMNYSQKHPERWEFFEGLEKRGLRILKGMNLYDFNYIIRFCAKSYVTVGTTSSAFTLPPDNRIRSMKGFRDWIGPFCGAPLIYDDFVDIKPLADIVPLYKYGDINEAYNLIIGLKNDAEKRNSLCKAQTEWAESNSLEQQFMKLFTKHKLLEN